MQPLELSGAVVFLFAHQDDEFAISPRIARECSAGRTVHCVYLTDGGESGLGPRCTESTAVLMSLGVREQNIAFIGTANEIPDGKLYQHASKAFDALAAWLEGVGSVLSLYLPAWEGGHHDHDVTHALGLGALRRANVRIELVWQFPLYTAARVNGLFRVMKPLPENGDVSVRRLTLCEALQATGRIFRYPSQWKSFVGLAPGAAAQFLFARREVVQSVNPRRTAERPHSGALLYETRYQVGFESVRAALVAAGVTGSDDAGSSLAGGL